MGVAYHANYLRWFEMGRSALLREIGFPYSELEKIPIWLPLAQAHCDYKKPAHYDEILEIVTHISEMGHVSIVLSYDIVRKTDGELLVAGYTRHGITNDKLKPVSLKKAYPELYQTLMTAMSEE